VQAAGLQGQPGHRGVHPVTEEGFAGLVPRQVQGLDVGVRVPVAEVAHSRGDDDADGVADDDPGGLGGGLGGRGG
jgi:hypothetical protein